jgi:hypothetical protein
VEDEAQLKDCCHLTSKIEHVNLIVADVGASLSVSCHISDFIDGIKRIPHQTLKTLSQVISVNGQSLRSMGVLIQNEGHDSVPLDADTNTRMTFGT